MKISAVDCSRKNLWIQYIRNSHRCAKAWDSRKSGKIIWVENENECDIPIASKSTRAFGRQEMEQRSHVFVAKEHVVFLLPMLQVILVRC
jgi:hypothetical protein